MRVPSHHWVTSCLIFHCQSKACHTYPINLKNIQNWKSFRNHNLSSDHHSSVVDFPTRMFPSDIQPTVEESLKKGRRESRPPRFYFLPSLFWTLWPTPLAICFDYTWNCQFATPKAQFPSFFCIAKSLKNKRKIHFRVKLSLHSNIKLCRYLFWNI